MQTEKVSVSVRTVFSYGLIAYFIWGFFPLYFKQLKHLNPFEVVSHRIVWSLLFLALLIIGKSEVAVTHEGVILLKNRCKSFYCRYDNSY